MQYQLTYKCLLCGKPIFVGDSIEMSKDEITEFAPSHGSSKEYTHLCEDGSYGNAVYAGYRIVDYRPKSV